MKRVFRLGLSNATLAHLDVQQAKVDGESDTAAQARRAETLWRSKARSSLAGRAAFSEVEETLSKMCNGPGLCMYCESNEATDVEHVKPRSRYPGETFRWVNLLFACPTCNSRYKRDGYHDNFMDPSALDFSLWDRWTFSALTGQYFPHRSGDAGAEATLKILGFERRWNLALRRQLHLETLILGIRNYGKAKSRGRDEEAKKIARTFTQLFPALVEWVLLQDPSPLHFPEVMAVRKVKSRFPEIVEDALG